MFGEEVGFRPPTAFVFLSLLTAAGSVALVLLRLLANWTLPLDSAVFGLLNDLTRSERPLLGGIRLSYLALRSNMAFLPLRDYSFYILELKQVVAEAD